MSDLIKFGNATLPAAADLSAALRSLNMGVETMSVILKMDKTGHWIYGIDQTEIDKEGLWAVNPCSFTKGYIAWGDRKSTRLNSSHSQQSRMPSSA